MRIQPAHPTFVSINRVKNFGSFARPARIRTVEYEIGPEESVSTAVVRAVSAVVGCETHSLRPLADVIDPTALDTLFDPQYDGTPRTGGRLSFVYNDCCITIDNGEYLTLQLLEDRICDERDHELSDSCVR
ncbi:HalOD1 output domain-containing protein [Halobellus inordinatus]|uniref:HalOD1 output domain-containing protein n=1 Tax=Halobellus inordinatus TaxID=1126236 RepID=UPI00210E5C9F|nr:HalOD1 output domain-containing protein [Halobellus inordinatus]